MIEHKEFHRASSGFQFQAKLVLQGSKYVGAIFVRSYRVIQAELEESLESGLVDYGTAHGWDRLKNCGKHPRFPSAAGYLLTALPDAVARLAVSFRRSEF